MMNSYLKLAAQGNTGTGKSMTGALLLLGLSVERHGKAPVLVFDTEPGWQFVRPLFEAEGVELIVRNGQHFKGLTDALREANQRKCCGFAVDSLTHPWTELLRSHANPDGRVPMHKFNSIKKMWNDYVVEFMDSPLHCVACGRLQWEMMTVADESGGYDTVRGDSKMKAGGGESFGYEPHLLVEMSREQMRGSKKKNTGIGKLSSLEYVAFVLKDRARALNGQSLRFHDFTQYKKGRYGEVYGAFLPHLQALDSIAGVKIGQATSAAIIPEGNSEYYRRQQQVKIQLEEIEGLMTSLWPGQDAKSKKVKANVIYVLFNTRSWAKVETTPLGELEIAHRTLASFERDIKPGGALHEVELDEHRILMTLSDIHTRVSAEVKQSSLPDPPQQAAQEGGSGGTSEPPSDLWTGQESELGI